MRILDALTLAVTVNLSVGSRARSDGKDSIGMMVDAAAATERHGPGRVHGGVGAARDLRRPADRPVPPYPVCGSTTVVLGCDAPTCP